MKKIYSLFFLLACMASLNLYANEITVKGFVKFPDGALAPNIKVRIFVETPCVREVSVTTNADGFYTGKVHCENAIKKLQVSIVCGGQIIALLREPSANNVVEANFKMCTHPVACVAKFTAEPKAPVENQKFPFKFNSSGSEIAADDKIVQRRWSFGDGVIINEGTVDPVHNYTKPGVYEACLTIKTSKGCTSTKCIRIEVKPRCHADFKFEPINQKNAIRFNSNIATSAPNDPVVNRSWNFGDGSPIVKGNIEPVHFFPHPGTYTVCLVVWTAGGCESKECKRVVVPEHKPACSARFSFERIGPKKFRFNSGLSVVAPGDEVTERQWEFRDGTEIIKTRDISLLHEFLKPGVYEVCLKIKTAKGCESKFCVAVRVEEGNNNTEGSVKIISLYPSPVHAELKVLVFSRTNHIPATLSIVDVYGQVKWTKQVWLAQGNNPFEIPTQSLLPGPYFFRVVTSYGVQSKLIHKI